MILVDIEISLSFWQIFQRRFRVCVNEWWKWSLHGPYKSNVRKLEEQSFSALLASWTEEACKKSVTKQGLYVLHQQSFSLNDNLLRNGVWITNGATLFLEKEHWTRIWMSSLKFKICCGEISEIGYFVSKGHN